MQNAWVLHRKPYRETSALVDLLTADGRQRCVIRGKGRDALLSPFIPLTIELGPVRDLRALKSIEAIGPALSLTGQRLFCGLYINELCVRLLPEQDPCPEFLSRYAQTLVALARDESVEPWLRRFELDLLAVLGFDWSVAELNTGETVQPDLTYWVHPESGPRLAPANAPDSYPGSVLLAMAQQDFTNSDVLLAAKRLNRARLGALLGPKPLQSRLLMQGLQS